MGKRTTKLQPYSLCLSLAMTIVLISGASISHLKNAGQLQATPHHVSQLEASTEHAERPETFAEWADPSGNSTAYDNRSKVASSPVDSSVSSSTDRKETVLSEKRSAEAGRPASAKDSSIVRCLNSCKEPCHMNRTMDIRFQLLCGGVINREPQKDYIKDYRTSRKTTEKQARHVETRKSPIPAEPLERSLDDRYDDVRFKPTPTAATPSPLERAQPLEKFARKHFLFRVAPSATDRRSITLRRPLRITATNILSLILAAKDSASSRFISGPGQTNAVIQGKQTRANVVSTVRSTQTRSGSENYFLKKHVKKTHPFYWGSTAENHPGF